VSHRACLSLLLVISAGEGANEGNFQSKGGVMLRHTGSTNGSDDDVGDLRRHASATAAESTGGAGVLKTLFMIQSATAGLIGVLLLIAPDGVRDIIGEAMLVKCEKLSGCGLAPALSSLLGALMLSLAFASFTAMNLKDPAGKEEMSKVFCLLNLLLGLVLAKDSLNHVYSLPLVLLVTPHLALAGAMWAFGGSTGKDHRRLVMPK